MKSISIAAMAIAVFPTIAIAKPPGQTVCSALYVLQSNPDILTPEARGYFSGALSAVERDPNFDEIRRTYAISCNAAPGRTVDDVLEEAITSVSGQ